MEIFGIDISGLPEHHRQNLIQLYYGKNPTTSRKKEFQSSIVFYNQFKDTPDIALRWKQQYAPSLNTSAILIILKQLTKRLNLHLHRICKTAYPIYVYISHYYEQLKPYLETLSYVDTIEVSPAKVPHLNPFTHAEFQYKSNYSRENQYCTIINLASDLSAIKSSKIEYTISMIDPKSGPFFIAIQKINNKYFSIVKEDVEQVQEVKVEAKPKIILPSIQDLCPFPPVSDFQFPIFA